MELISRKYDIFSQKEDLEPLYSMKHFPIYMGATEESQDNDLFADMDWTISRGSGMLQLTKLVPDGILYKTSHNGSVGRLWREHHTKFAELIHKYIGRAGVKSIIEIGGGNGILNKIYTEKYGKMEWTIIEPSSVEPIEGCEAKYIRELWDDNFQYEEKIPGVECLVHSHVLEHLYDLKGFMKQNEQLLSDGQKMIFSVPNLKETLKRKYTNALNFEHTYFISEDYVEEALKEHAFGIIEKQYFKEDHSIFYVTEKGRKNGLDKFADFESLYIENKKILEDYIDYHRCLINRFNNRIRIESRPIYLFGAHIFSQYLIHFGLDTTGIKYVLDNDKGKQNKRLYGTSLNIRSPKILAEETAPIVILKAANYGEEIKEDILNNINSNTVFWE